MSLKIIDIQSGFEHFYGFSNDDGKIYGWVNNFFKIKGYNRVGQIGNGKQNEKYYSAISLDYSFSIKRFVLGLRYTMAISKDNILYGWGENNV
jgi:alpha-tubulin suppressor-like RCC1 family protein